MSIAPYDDLFDGINMDGGKKESTFSWWEIIYSNKCIHSFMSTFKIFPPKKYVIYNCEVRTLILFLFLIIIKLIITYYINSDTY